MDDFVHGLRGCIEVYLASCGHSNFDRFISPQGWNTATSDLMITRIGSTGID
jgi:hypothetical protein